MKRPVYFGTYSKGAGNGLLSGEFDESTGGLRLGGSLDIENPSYLVFDGGILYGVSETETYDGQSGGRLFSAAARGGGAMSLLSAQGTGGGGPCHLCVKDGYVFTANYGEGSLSVFERDGEGLIKPSQLALSHRGKGPDPGRQTRPHIHFAAVTPDDKYLAVCDLGLDRVFFYPYSAGAGLSAKAKVYRCPPGSGPRHMVFSGNGAFAYVLTEMGSTVLANRYEDGEMTLLQEASALPAGFYASSKKSSAAAIRISPDGGAVLASNRGHDSIARFGILDGGALAPPEFIMTGAEPRDFTFSPGGGWILAANQGDNMVTVHRADTGEIVGRAGMPKPCCVAFGE